MGWDSFSELIFFLTFSSNFCYFSFSTLSFSSSFWVMCSFSSCFFKHLHFRFLSRHLFVDSKLDGFHSWPPGAFFYTFSPLHFLPRWQRSTERFVFLTDSSSHTKLHLKAFDKTTKWGNFGWIKHPLMLQYLDQKLYNYSMIVWNWYKVNSYISALKHLPRLPNRSKRP